MLLGMGPLNWFTSKYLNNPNIRHINNNLLHESVMYLGSLFGPTPIKFAFFVAKLWFQSIHVFVPKLSKAYDGLPPWTLTLRYDLHP